MNLLASAWLLSKYQFLNPKRRWVTSLLILFPVIICIVASLANLPDKSEFYEKFVSYALGWVYLPFLALFWGSGVVSDEIDGKTLVYLWTRPRHRGLLMLLKLVFSWVWVVLICLVGPLSAVAFFSASGSQTFSDNAPMILWDWRALSLSAIAWSSLGFVLSVFTRKPLLVGLLIAFLWELVVQFVPVIPRWLSIMQPMETLVTHATSANTDGLLSKFVTTTPLTETQAIATLLIIIVSFCLAATLLLPHREFLGDDPARNQ